MAAFLLVLASMVVGANADGFLSMFGQQAKGKMGHVRKLLQKSAQSTVCKAVPVKSLCASDDSGLEPKEPLCLGEGCCVASSCHSSFLPGMKCDTDRGSTTCVGGSLTSSGTCQCRTGSCDSAGRCAVNTDSAYTSLYEDAQKVPEEDFTVSGLAYLGLFSGCLLGLFVMGRRMRHRRQFPGEVDVAIE